MNAKDRFYSRKWGVFNHYLSVLQNDSTTPNSYGKQTDWDTLVNEFDVQTLVKNLRGVLRNHRNAGHEIYDCPQRDF